MFEWDHPPIVMLRHCAGAGRYVAGAMLTPPRLFAQDDSVPVGHLPNLAHLKLHARVSVKLLGLNEL